jgi:hypothetical protein
MAVWEDGLSATGQCALRRNERLRGSIVKLREVPGTDELVRGCRSLIVSHSNKITIRSISIESFIRARLDDRSNRWMKRVVIGDSARRC